jgi:hypothetical protein
MFDLGEKRRILEEKVPQRYYLGVCDRSNE